MFALDMTKRIDVPTSGLSQVPILAVKEHLIDAGVEVRM
jgi:hypothetical protein